MPQLKEITLGYELDYICSNKGRLERKYIKAEVGKTRLRLKSEHNRFYLEGIQVKKLYEALKKEFEK